MHPGEKQASGHTRAEQLSYNLTQMRLALNRFLEIPALVRNFAADGPGIDLGKALEDRKIILFRLDPGLGPVGEDLCRIFIESWYEAIITRGTENPVPSFTFLDEFQAICDLGNGRFSDRRFVAESREFQGAVAILTQNVAGLRGSDEDKQSLVHNMNTKIMLYNSDPRTSEAIKPHTGPELGGNPDILTTLERGEAYVIRYDSGTGKHITGKESCNKSHDRLKAALEAIPDEEIRADAQEPPKRHSVLQLVRDFRSAKTGEEQSGREIKTVNELLHRHAPARQASPELAIVRDIIENEDWEIAAHAGTSELVFKFPQFFFEDAVIELPAGWVSFIENILCAVSEARLEMRMRGLKVEGEKIVAEYEEEESSGAAKTLFLTLLKKAGSFCPVCGGYSSKRTGELMFLCPECVIKFGLDGGKPKKRIPSPVEIMRPAD